VEVVQGNNMDWNHDGKHNWQDHAVYNNIISDNGKNNSSQSSGNNGAKNSISHNEGSFGCGWVKWLLVIWVLDIIIKLFGD